MLEHRSLLLKVSKYCIATINDGKTPMERGNKQEMLQEVVENLEPELTRGERDKFLKLLQNYADIFATSPTDLGHTNWLRHRIDTGNTMPIRQPMRCVPSHRKEEVHTLLDNMLQKGVIEESASQLF